MKAVLFSLFTMACVLVNAQKFSIKMSDDGKNLAFVVQTDGNGYPSAPTQDKNSIVIKTGDEIKLISDKSLIGYTATVKTQSGQDAPTTLYTEFDLPDAGTFSFTVADDQMLTNSAGENSAAQYGTSIIIGITKKGTSEQGSIKLFLTGNGGSKPPSSSIISATDQADLFGYVQSQIQSKGYHYVTGQNIIFDSKGIIHIYLDENLNPIYSYFPTVAKSGHDNFQFHIISKNDLSSTSITITSTGTYTNSPISQELTGSAGAQSIKNKKFYQYDSPIFGPYTGSFPFEIIKNSGPPLDREIKLLNTSRVSLNTGIVATFLKNPDNISTFVKPNGDTTLIANNPTTRGFLGLVLTFHIKPRNLDIKPRDIYERLGISLGTNLTANSFNNFFGGLNIELTNGLFINGGVHYGQVNYVVGYSKFKYGEDVFSGNLEVREKWAIAPYIAVNIDAGLFAKAFKNIFSVNP